MKKVKDLKNQLEDKSRDQTLLNELNNKFKIEIEKIKNDYENKIKNLTSDYENKIKISHESIYFLNKEENDNYNENKYDKHED